MELKGEFLYNAPKTGRRPRREGKSEPPAVQIGRKSITVFSGHRVAKRKVK